jgi:hypothetical protein
LSRGAVKAVLLVLALHAPAALAALPYWLAAGPTVVEYRNSLLDHYFLTASVEEMAAIDAGLAGPGWSRTGFTFGSAQPSGGYSAPVIRFRGISGVGPNSHFFTANWNEAESLEAPGSAWVREGDAFRVVPGPHCSHYLPVYRLYNGRGPADPNHRYVTSAAERDAMLARGWLDEGVAFCAMREQRIPLQSYDGYFDLEGRIRPGAECENPAINLGGCMAVYNLDPPVRRLLATDTRYLGFLTWIRPEVFDLPSPSSPPSEHVFIQRWEPTGYAPVVGIHLDTAHRGASRYSSVNPMYQLPTSGVPGAIDGPLFPWRPRTTGDESELLLTASVALPSLILRGSDSHLYGHTTLNFMDQRSGRRVHFNVLAYGTMDGADLVAPDTPGRKVIVGTTFRDSPWMRNLGSPTLKPGFLGLRLHTTIGSPFYSGRYGFIMNRHEFQNVLNAARSVDPALSPDPNDYLLDNFQFKNEVAGDGKIGVRLSDFGLHVMRR